MSTTTNATQPAWPRGLILLTQLRAKGFHLKQGWRTLYQVTDRKGQVILGPNFDATLDDVERHFGLSTRPASTQQPGPRLLESVAARENRLRRLALTKGNRWFVIKDRSATRDPQHQGGYQVIDYQQNIMSGSRFELSLDDVEQFLNSQK